MNKIFEKIDRLIEFKKGIVIRQYKGGMAFDTAVRYLAHKAYGDEEVIKDTGKALSAIDNLRIENLIKNYKGKKSNFDEKAVNKLFDTAGWKLYEMPFIAGFSDYYEKSPVLKALAAFPDKRKYLITQTGMYFAGCEGHVLKMAMEYNGIEFFTGWEDNAVIPENLYLIVLDKGGYYSFGDTSEVFPSILIKPDPTLIADDRKRELHILVNEFIMKETGCCQFLLGEKYFQGGEPFDYTVESVINAVYGEFFDFLDNGHSIVTNDDRLIMKLRKEINRKLKRVIS